MLEVNNLARISHSAVSSSPASSTVTLALASLALGLFALAFATAARVCWGLVSTPLRARCTALKRRIRDCAAPTCPRITRSVLAALVGGFLLGLSVLPIAILAYALADTREAKPTPTTEERIAVVVAAQEIPGSTQIPPDAVGTLLIPESVLSDNPQLLLDPGAVVGKTALQSISRGTFITMDMIRENVTTGVVALQEIPIGSRITEDALAYCTAPYQAVPDESAIVTDIETAIGMTAGATIQRGSFITATLLVNLDSFKAEADDFSDEESGFGQDRGDRSRRLYDSGSYTIEVNGEGEYALATKGDYMSLIMELDVVSQAEDGYAGAVFRHTSDESFYAFIVSPRGWYKLRKKLPGGPYSWEEITDFRFSDQIRMGLATNRLRLACFGADVALYVNGQYLGTVQGVDEDFSEGQIGMIAGTLRDEHALFRFDNLTISSY